ncbi:transmembrane amino acid transporter protein-domain-containing protein, partial [Chytriomyces sp. MP71]
MNRSTPSPPQRPSSLSVNVSAACPTSREVRVRPAVATPVVGAYSAVPHADLEADDEDDDDDGHSVVHAGVADPSATVLSSAVNLTNTILGSGMLAMPKALASTGLALGSLLILASAAASVFGLTLLSLCAARIGRHSSFFQIAKITYPQAAIGFDLAIAVKCFGVSISYLVIIGALVPSVMHSIYPDSSPDHIIFSKTCWISLAMILLIPVAFAKQLNSLRHTSALALCAVVYLVAIVFGHFVLTTSGEGD